MSPGFVAFGSGNSRLAAGAPERLPAVIESRRSRLAERSDVAAETLSRCAFETSDECEWRMNRSMICFSTDDERKASGPFSPTRYVEPKSTGPPEARKPSRLREFNSSRTLACAVSEEATELVLLKIWL